MSAPHDYSFSQKERPLSQHHIHQGVIFDLDGTLLDTLTDLAESMNHVLGQKGWQIHPVDAYRRFVGDGVELLVWRTLPSDLRQDSIIADCVRDLREEYALRWARTTRPYAEVEELLRGLVSRNIPMAVLSNKPNDATQDMVRHYFPGTAFQIIAGAMPDKPKKPDPGVALEMARQMRIPPDAMLFLGDSDADMQTARAARMVPLGAAWGFRGREELAAAGASHVLEKPLELLDWLGYAAKKSD